MALSSAEAADSCMSMAMASTRPRNPAHAPVTVGGITYFSTNRPLAGTVEVAYTQTNADGTTSEVQKRVPFIIGGINPKGSPIEAARINPSIKAQRKRSYWCLENAR